MQYKVLTFTVLCKRSFNFSSSTISGGGGGSKTGTEVTSSSSLALKRGLNVIRDSGHSIGFSSLRTNVCAYITLDDCNKHPFVILTYNSFTLTFSAWAVREIKGRTFGRKHHLNAWKIAMSLWRNGSYATYSGHRDPSRCFDHDRTAHSLISSLILFLLLRTKQNCSWRYDLTMELNPDLPTAKRTLEPRCHLAGWKQ